MARDPSGNDDRHARLALVIVGGWQAEIERAIDRVKKSVNRSGFDRWFRRQWYKAEWRNDHEQKKLRRFATGEQTAVRSVGDEVM